VLDEDAGWGDLVAGLRPAACWTKGGNCRSLCLRCCSEIGEGIERRVASSPSPQQVAPCGMSSFLHNELRSQKTQLGGLVPKVQKHLLKARYGKGETNTSVQKESDSRSTRHGEGGSAIVCAREFFATHASLCPLLSIKATERVRVSHIYCPQPPAAIFSMTPKL
jgi:hypothetical protein